MARKDKYVTIEDEGRDKGKVFYIKEMPVYEAFRWARRALLAIAKSGVDVSTEVQMAGMAGVFIAGVKSLAHIDGDEAEALMDQMLSCARIVRDKRNMEMTFEVLEEDIEEISTRFFLFFEALDLHMGFSSAGPSQTSTSEPAPETTRNTPDTQTATSSSERSSRRARQR